MTENEPAPPSVPEVAATTGEPQVDEALRKLDDLAGRPLNEHPAVFEQIHGALTGALGTLDSAATAGPIAGGSGTGDPGSGS